MTNEQDQPTGQPASEPNVNIPQPDATDEVEGFGDTEPDDAFDAEDE